jgi:hypothetical protein
MSDIKKYHQLCGINAPKHLANTLTMDELNEIMSQKEQKIFLRPRVDDPKVLMINEHVVGAGPTCVITKYGNAVVIF